MWFDSWQGIFRTAVVGVASYALLILMLRISGKRTLAKLNAFDLVVTVAMGSTLATILLSKDTAFAEGATAFLVLVLGQYVVAVLSRLWPFFRSVVTSEPQLLLLNGRFIETAMRKERMTQDDVLSAIRGGGFTRLEDVGAVVLETDGSLHVLPATAHQGDVLRGVSSSPEP